jgi:hypothetical protein
MTIQVGLGKKQDPISKVTRGKNGAGGVVHAVECLLSDCETLSSNASTTPYMYIHISIYRESDRQTETDKDRDIDRDQISVVYQHCLWYLSWQPELTIHLECNLLNCLPEKCSPNLPCQANHSYCGPFLLHSPSGQCRLPN